MTKLAIPFAITAAVSLTTAACERKEIEREADDVVEARKKVQEEKQELQEDKREGKQEVREAEAELRKEKAELALETKDQLDEAEKRFKKLDEQATTVTKTIDITTGPGAEIHQAQLLAKTKLEAARNAKTPEEVQQALNDARDALDKLEHELDDIHDKV
jgi:hypothetical protein